MEAAKSTEQSGIHHVACFLYHQAVEMALKGALERLGLDHTGHALPALYRALCRARGVEIDDELEESARRLNPTYIKTRYPDKEEGGVPAEKYGAVESEAARHDAEALLIFVRGEGHGDG